MEVGSAWVTIGTCKGYTHVATSTRFLAEISGPPPGMRFRCEHKWKLAPS